MPEVREGEILAGKYRVERVLGEGGMGVVVAATHIALEERVALKFMLPSMLVDANAAKRFVREAKAAVKLKSEHVAKVLDVGTLETGAPYIVMEYLEGDDLGKVLDRQGRLSLEEVADYVIQACDAIAEAHANGIVHRDLKPSNLFLAKRHDGAALVKVLDFGISKASALGESGLSMTKSNAMLGSPLYMAPEQMKSSRDVDSRADVWSLGVILFELATNRLPFDAETVGALMAKVLTEKPPAVQSLQPDLPDAFGKLVESCLQNDVAKRCPDVAEIAISLAPYAPKGARMLAERIEMVLHGSKKLRVAIASTRPPSMSTIGLDATVLEAQPASSSPQLPRITSSAWEGTTAKAPRKPIVYAVAALAACAVLGGAVAGVRAMGKPSAIATTAPVESLAPAAPITSASVVAAASPSAAPAESAMAAAATSKPEPEPKSAPVVASGAAQSKSAPASVKAPAGGAAKTTTPPAPSGSSKKKGVLDSWD